MHVFFPLPLTILLSLISFVFAKSLDCRQMGIMEYVQVGTLDFFNVDKFPADDGFNATVWDRCYTMCSWRMDGPPSGLELGEPKEAENRINQTPIGCQTHEKGGYMSFGDHNKLGQDRVMVHYAKTKDKDTDKKVGEARCFCAKGYYLVPRVHKKDITEANTFFKCDTETVDRLFDKDFTTTFDETKGLSQVLLRPLRRDLHNDVHCG